MVLTTLVIKMRSPQTTGEDQPVPSTSIFQRTFSVEDQVSGSPASSATPMDCGPRNCGQLSEANASAVSAIKGIISYILRQHVLRSEQMRRVFALMSVAVALAATDDNRPLG